MSEVEPEVGKNGPESNEEPLPPQYTPVEQDAVAESTKDEVILSEEEKTPESEPKKEVETPQAVDDVSLEQEPAPTVPVRTRRKHHDEGTGFRAHFCIIVLLNRYSLGRREGKSLSNT